MERLTSNKPIPDMNMLELAYNSCYVDKERKARYRDYDLDIDSRQLVRNLMKDMCDEDLSGMSDEEFDEYMAEMLSVEMDSQVGLLALFYRNLWAMANLRETLKKYEDLEEQGRLVILPCKVGARLYWIGDEDDYGHKEMCIKQYSESEKVTGFSLGEDGEVLVFIGYDNSEPDIVGGRYALLTREEAEVKLKELRGNQNEVL